MRDFNILKSFQREVDMCQKTVRSKKRYTRKIKHKKKLLDY